MREKLNKLLQSKIMTWGLAPLFIAFVSFLQFQASVSRIPFINAEMTIVAFLWNLLTCWLLHILLMVIINRVHIALLVGSVLSFGWSVANYYVLLFHGAPLTFLLLKQFATTMDVISSYRFFLDKYSGMILFGFIASLAVVIILWIIHKGKPVFPKAVRLYCAIGCVILLASNIYFGIFSEISFKPKNSIQFSWASSAGRYGFLALQLESHFQEGTFTISFDNYSEENVLDVYNELINSKTQQSLPEEYPDIILILNECFYDLEQVVDIETNISPLENYYKIDNAIKGYVVASGEGGGTNRSEYELLTSFSTSLLPNQSPFLTLNLENHASVVSYLENFGYETYAAHCAKSSNYNRKYGYPTLGFDHSYFDLDFDGLESYGNRANTDESTYKNLIKWYEEPSDNPKFMYLLTYQNHGGWEQNPEELDTVKVENDFGVYTGQVNEYLSSLRLSDEELVKLLDYFETVDRPVIFCMLGDHGPSFAKNIADPSISEQDLTYLIKSTPLVIWSNYGLKNENLGYISLNYVAPKLMQTIGLPLSPFYQYQMELMDKVPIIMSYNTFFDADLALVPYNESDALTKDVQNYFSMCFGHLKERKFAFLFDPME